MTFPVTSFQLKNQILENGFSFHDQGKRMKLAMPWPRHLVTRLSPQRPGFSPRLVHVGFVVDSVALGHGFLPVLQFSLSLSFHHCSMFIHLSLAPFNLSNQHGH